MICIYSRSLPPFTAAYRRSFVQQAHLSPQLMIYDRCARRRRQCGAVRGEDGARNGRVSTVRAITAARRCVEVADMTAAVSGGAVRGNMVARTPACGRMRDLAGPTLIFLTARSRPKVSKYRPRRNIMRRVLQVPRECAPDAGL